MTGEYEVAKNHLIDYESSIRKLHAEFERLQTILQELKKERDSLFDKVTLIIFRTKFWAKRSRDWMGWIMTSNSRHVMLGWGWLTRLLCRSGWVSTSAWWWFYLPRSKLWGLEWGRNRWRLLRYANRVWHPTWSDALLLYHFNLSKTYILASIFCPAPF